MSNAPTGEQPKIVNIFNRGPYKAEQRIEPGSPDLSTIRALEEAREMAKAGEITGFLAIGWDPIDRQFWRHVTLPILEGYEPRNSAAMMLGALQMLQDDLKDIAFWAQGYDPLCLYERDEAEAEDQ